MKKVNKVKIVSDLCGVEMLAENSMSVVLGGHDEQTENNNPILDDCSCIKFPNK